MLHTYSADTLAYRWARQRSRNRQGRWFLCCTSVLLNLWYTIDQTRARVRAHFRSLVSVEGARPEDDVESGEQKKPAAASQVQDPVGVSVDESDDVLFTATPGMQAYEPVLTVNVPWGQGFLSFTPPRQ